MAFAVHVFMLAQFATISARCPDGGSVTTRVAGDEVRLVDMPAMSEGGVIYRLCDEVKEGYAGSVKVTCLGGQLVARADRCRPSPCREGQAVQVGVTRADGPGLVATVALAQDLAHNGEEQQSCAGLFDGYSGHVRLVCRLGKLQTDSSSCRPVFGGERTVWRLVNSARVPGSFLVFEVGFFTDPACGGEPLAGEAVAASEDTLAGNHKELAFDGDGRTAWGARCDRGCDPGTAWVGLVVREPSDLVRCVRLLQSRVSCCRSQQVRLEVWDGGGWQQMHEWDMGLAASPNDFHSAVDLHVPVSCVVGTPEEASGVVHDCGGPPVVGMQEGGICYASCRDGWYGGSTPFECQSSGIFVGSPPTCYEIRAALQVVLFAGAVGAAFCFACQYRFWCMYKKGRIGHLGLDIPAALKGKWFEQDGFDGWDRLELAIENSELDLPYEPEGTHSGPEAALRSAIKQKVLKRQSSDTEAPEKKKRRRPTVLHGLCDICQDPDVCWTCILCPICRIADTWHTIGRPAWLSYWNVVLMYYLCPCLWPVFNFLGRLRLRQTFMIPLQPHRDCVMHCCCCCLCAPCAICQEARLVDAPGVFFYARKKLHLTAPVEQETMILDA